MGDRGEYSFLKEWFNPERIVEDYVVPEFFVTRAGMIEMLPGDNLRYRMCCEHPAQRGGATGKLEQRFNMIIPLRSMLFARGYVNAWIESQGLVVPTPKPPIALLSEGVRH